MNHIRFVQFDTKHDQNFIFDIPEGHDCYLLLLTHTKAQFWVDNEWQDYPANHAVLFAPNQKILYRAMENSYSDDWLRFETNEAFIQSGFNYGVPFPLSDSEFCHHLFQLLSWEHSIPGPNSTFVIDHLLQVLFTKLRENIDFTVTSPHFSSLCVLRKDIYNNPQKNWNVDSMADKLHISTGYLQTLYRKQYGLSCMEDVIQSRLQRARYLLHYSTRTVAEISTLCGYRNVEHFCRQFKKNIGYSPKEYSNDQHIQSNTFSYTQQ